MLIHEHLELNIVDKDKEGGIEIEMEGRNLQLHRPTYWRQDNDGSLRGESMEFVLRYPCERAKVSGMLGYLQTKLKEQEATLSPSPRCGVHVHINCQHMKIQQVFNFSYLYYIFEDILMEYCGELRKGNLFCMTLEDAGGIIPSLIEAQANMQLNRLHGKIQNC